MDRCVAVDSVACAALDSREGVLEGGGIEIDQVHFSIVLEQSVELDVVAVSGAEDAERLSGLRSGSARQLTRPVLPVTAVERRVGPRACVREALFADFVVETGAHRGE